MKGNKIDSTYLLTRLYSTDYFHYYSNPAFFAAYFFPFVAIGKTREYLETELNEKLINIKENKHGNFYNYATQGFGNVAFYKPNVSFEFFYDRLCSYDNEKKRYFNIQNQVINLESDTMRNDLVFVLSKEGLLLKRDVLVLDSIKEELINDLKKYNVKYVLAKILYYIVDENHKIPNVNEEIYTTLIKRLNLGSEQKNLNVFLGFRRELDSKIESLKERLMSAKSIQLLCLDGISLFGSESVFKEKKDAISMFRYVLNHNSGLTMEIILSQPECKSYIDATEFQMNYNHLRLPKSELSSKALNELEKVKYSVENEKVVVKTTTKNIPYSLFIVKYNDSKLDYIKVDLYSPFIDANEDRPSMYIFNELTPDLFAHFTNVFEHMWKNDRYSTFI